MNEAASRLTQRVLGWHLLFSLVIAGLISSMAPRLLLLERAVSSDAARALLIAVLTGGAFALARTSWLLRRQRFTLRALALGSRSIEPFELRELGAEPWRITAGWGAPIIAALTLGATVLRPSILDLVTAASLGLLGAVIVAAACLPLHVVVREQFVRAVELAPPDAMREVLETEERGGVLSARIPRRLLAAVATPVAFLTIGAALITNAHLRRADERQREETARALARSSLELGPGVISGAGLDSALERAAELGFRARVDEASTENYGLGRDQDGIMQVVTPLDAGTAEVRFSGSTVGLFSAETLAIALAALIVAGLLGMSIGRALGDDLRLATRGLRLLGTDAVLGGTRVVRPARFEEVFELGQAIERLADRFRLFARAQQRAIDAREAATRMRGLFLASVSHDLKSPLNAVLGFTELVRQLEPLSPGQSESLAFIEHRGRELLALIETILDAARVEAGQLTLERERVLISDLIGASIEKGRDLGRERPIEVVGEIAPGIPSLEVDRLQMSRALATLIGHALRSAQRSPVRVRALPRPHRVRIVIEVPSQRFSARQLSAMLDPSREPGASPHRGLALGLGLARAVIGLHGGSVTVERDHGSGPAFRVDLPAEE